MNVTCNLKQEFSDYQPFVSVIIPALNSEKTLDACLNAISLMDYPKEKLEVILVDNGSTDRTVEIGKKYNVKVFIKPKVNISSLRNFGVKMAKGDIYAFVDSDCLVSKDWLNNALNHLKKDVVAIAGCGPDIPDDSSWIEKSWFFYKDLEARTVKHLGTGNLLVKKSVFMKVGGFNENLITGEDSEFCRRIREMGYLIISDNKIRSTHLGNPKTLYAFFKKEIWHGKGMLGTKKTDKWNRPFIASIIYLLSYVAFILGLPVAFYLNNPLPVFIPISFIILIPLIASFHHSIQSKNLKKFPFLVPIYFAYCMGRMISLFYIFKFYKPKN